MTTADRRPDPAVRHQTLALRADARSVRRWIAFLKVNGRRDSTRQEIADAQALWLEASRLRDRLDKRGVVRLTPVTAAEYGNPGVIR